MPRRGGQRRYPAAFAAKVDEALAESMETQAWLDHALECQYISVEEHATLDAAWQGIGGRLQRMLARTEDFCKKSE